MIVMHWGSVFVSWYWPEVHISNFYLSNKVLCQTIPQGLNCQLVQYQGVLSLLGRQALQWCLSRPLSNNYTVSPLLMFPDIAILTPTTGSQSKGAVILT
jgi:hypothetical protein